MAIESTKLSTLIARMQRWAAVFRNTEEQNLVSDLDSAIRALKREHRLPWTLQKSTLRVFADQLEYAPNTAHDGLAILEGQEENYYDKPLPYYTSIEEFYQDPNNQSQIAEIWDGGCMYLGVRNKNLTGRSQQVNSAEIDSGYTISGDITAKTLDTVLYKTGNGSMRFTVVNGTNSALAEHTFTAFSDSNYLRKYYFATIYLSVIPTNGIKLRFGTDSTNYLYKTVTTQFSGQPLKAGDWNVVAFDLNSPDGTVGTITSTSFAYEAWEMLFMPSGFFNVDSSSVKEWQLMDYWFYSKNQVITLGNTTPNQEYFNDDNLVYSTDSVFVGPSEWSDVVLYDAILDTLADVENSKVTPRVQRKRDAALAKLMEDYPSMEKSIITHTWNFPSQQGNVVKVYQR